MTGREWGALIILAGLALLAVAFAAGIRALILAVTHQGRHEQREAEADREADTFIAELQGLPKPGLDYISDVTVRLPWTPPLPRVEPGPPIVGDITDARKPDGFLVHTGNLHPDLAERLASDTDVRVATGKPARCRCALAAEVPHYPAGHDAVASILSPAKVDEPKWDVARLADLGVDDIEHAFDTSQFEAVR